MPRSFLCGKTKKFLFAAEAHWEPRPFLKFRGIFWRGVHKTAARSCGRPFYSIHLSSSSSATACAAIPSPLPVKPRRSSVVAFTLTRSAGIPSVSAILRSICAV